MSESTYLELENLFLSLSDRTRLRLLSLMSEREVSVGFLAQQMQVSQPKISRHLAYLRNSGLVSTRRDGKSIYYSVKMPANSSVANVFQTSLLAIDPQHDSFEVVKDSSADLTDVNFARSGSEELEIFLL